MAYLFLLGAILAECGGTYMMKLSDGFSRLGPSAGCLGLYALCFFFLSKALSGMSLTVAYATWGALGIVLATTLSVLVFKEPINALTIVGIALCIGGVIMVNVFGSTH